MINILKKIYPTRLSKIATYLLRDEAIGGKVIVGAVALALIAGNTPLSAGYDHFWHIQFSIGFNPWVLSMDLRHWVSDGLMAFFFLVVGLELKREIVEGELKKFETASLPFAAAIGGMIVPALIYVVLNLGSDSLKGWAIPTATDIALAIGLLALLGRRIPPSVRLFLLTLAIVDDIAAVIIIAVFYSTGLHVDMLFVAGLLSVLIVSLHQLRLMSMPVFIILGIGLWLAIEASGVHASISGALLGLIAPLAVKGTRSSDSIADRAERAIIPFSTLVVVPLFAFANTGIMFNLDGFHNDYALRIGGGIILGLVVGKVLGIIAGTWLMVKLKVSKLPTNSNWSHIIGTGMLAGIGFTVSIFVTELAFDDQSYLAVSKASIFIASALSATLGLCALRFLSSSRYTK